MYGDVCASHWLRSFSGAGSAFEYDIWLVAGGGSGTRHLGEITGNRHLRTGVGRILE